MTRRQFLACLLMAMVALVLLPLQRFCEWGERWFGDRSRDFEMRLASYGSFWNRGPAYVQGPAYVHPDTYRKYMELFA